MSKTDVAWQCEMCRFTAFPQLPMDKVDYNWWESLTGKMPEQQNILPGKSQRNESGPWGNGKLDTQVEPFRMNIIYSQIPQTEPDEKGFLLIGHYEPVFQKMKELITKVPTLEFIPEFARVAFGAALMLPVEHREQGYKVLQELLPAVKIDIEDSSDLLYRINRTRDLKINSTDFEINRLSTWSTIQSSLVAIPLQPPNVGLSNVSLRDPSYAVRLEFDINNKPEPNKVLERKSIDSFFGQLVEFGLEIVEKGDVR